MHDNLFALKANWYMHQFDVRPDIISGPTWHMVTIFHMDQFDVWPDIMSDPVWCMVTCCA